MESSGEWKLTKLNYKHNDKEFDSSLYSSIEANKSFHPIIKYKFEAKIPNSIIELCPDNSNLALNIKQSLVKDLFIDPYQIQNLMKFKKKQMKAKGLSFYLYDTPIELELAVDKVDNTYTNLYEIYWNFNQIEPTLDEAVYFNIKAELEIPIFARYQPPNSEIYNKIKIPKTDITLGCYSNSLVSGKSELNSELLKTSEHMLIQPIIVPSTNPNLNPIIPCLTWYFVGTGLLYLLVSLFKTKFKQSYVVLPNTDPNFTLIKLKNDKELKDE